MTVYVEGIEEILRSLPCSAMPPPSAVTKNVAAGRFMK